MAFSHPRTVYLADTDAAGVVYFACVMNMCHEAYEESLAAARISLQQLIADSAIAIPIVHAEVSFFRPLFCGDKLLINLVAEQLSDNEFIVNYDIVLASSSQKKLAQGNTKHVCINPATRTRVKLPQTIIDWLKQYSRSQELVED
ncbi:acyl-CoA thioesterase [Pleurocapsales cyanobacterium LEGE 06147]|nr:acyl-CoA thioesterase [Pleurocapsales cyanobacterium LEGE 06147]